MRRQICFGKSFGRRGDLNVTATLLCATPQRGAKMALSRAQSPALRRGICRTSMRLCVLLRSARSIIIGNSTLTIRTFLFFPPLSATPPASTAILASSFSTGPPGDRGALQYHWYAIASKQLGLVPVLPRGLLSELEEQSRTRGGQSGGIEDEEPQVEEPQY